MSGTEDQTQTDVGFLLSEPAATALSLLTQDELHPANTLTTLQTLRQRFSPAQAGAILTLARLRVQATSKFPLADRMYFTAEALEQATAWTVALHRAEAIHRFAPPGPVLDLGCGIGGDTLALAQFREVIAYERDPERIAFAQANAHAAGLAHAVQFRNRDWISEMSSGHLPLAAAAFVDPARRVDGRRVFSLYEMQPSIDVIMQLQEMIPNVAVKVMPGVSDAEIPESCGVEFVSHDGTCKEAVLWFGDLAQHERWASVHAQQRWHLLVAGDGDAPVGMLAEGGFLYEPDPAVIRAGAFAELCSLLHGHLIDPNIAYIVSHTRMESVFASAFFILEVHPFNLKLLNQRLRALQFSSVELKKRGAPFEPESLRPRLRLSATGVPGVVLFTRIRTDPLMILATRV